MVSKSTEIKNKMGFHMRPAKDFATAMNNYQSDISIVVDNKKINGKSVMSIMAAAIKCGTSITLECDGPDEASMLSAAVDMVESGFGE